mmetsp:Transcript_6185/g.19262  ORF Transcript_6185/g.19262 Transcript_6185/m.19262 type:complete len:194 (-) Transcript_6185:65-646(-)
MAQPLAGATASQEDSKWAHGPGRRQQVWLHVYDIDQVTAWLNEAVLRAANLGAFHCGVEVLGDEWFFAWGESDATGVMWNEPRQHQVHIYRESLCMGETPLTDSEIRALLANTMDCWSASSYHPIKRNCVTFAEELLGLLRVSEPFPAWVRGAADAGRSPLVFPIADCAWRWVRWWNSRPGEEELLLRRGAGS